MNALHQRGHCPWLRLQLFNFVFWFTVVVSSAASSFISLGPDGTGVHTFDTFASVTGWTTAGVQPNSTAGIASGADLRTAVQTNTAANFTNALLSSTGSQSGRAAWHSSANFIYTRPAGVSYTVLMAALRNDSGFDAGTLWVEYQMTNFLSAADPGHAPGWQVFYSFTGNANEWIWIPSLSDVVTNGLQGTEVVLTSAWNSGTTLYLLWADDNAADQTDAGYGIDNFSVTPTPSAHSPINITNDLHNLTVSERGRATFSVGAEGAPKFFRWYRDGSLVIGSNQPTLVVERAAYPLDNGAQYFVVVSNAIGSVTSYVATLTVQPDLLSPSVVRAIGDVDLTRIRLAFSEALHTGAIVPTNFTLFETGTNPDTSPYLTFQVTLTQGTNVHLVTDARKPLKNYSVRITDVRDASFTNNIIHPNPIVVPISTELLLIGFDAQNIWRYDLNSGDRTGTGWEDRFYDDSHWPSGPAALGFDASQNDVPIRTDLPYAGDSVPLYLRTRFHLPSTNGLKLRLRHVIDDGAIYYLNGQEVFRHNVGTGAVSFATRAIAGAQEPALIQGPFEWPVTNAVVGDNVLAMMVVQFGSTSADLTAAAELTASISHFAEPWLQATRWTNDSLRLTLHGQIGTTNRIESVTGLSPGTLWMPWQQVFLTNDVQTLPPINASGPMQFFRVIKE